MILQAPTTDTKRKAVDPDPARRLPAFGLEDKEIPHRRVDRRRPAAADIDTR